MRERVQYKQVEVETEYRRGSTKSHTFGRDIRAKKFYLQPHPLMHLRIAEVFAST